tara:strand:- start:45 stop:353 length:309 start_codon:yes stop_codon:yes gene_type:complete
MKLEMPWSGWFNEQAKKRRKVEPWTLAKVNLEEEFEVEIILREVFNYIDPDDIPDLISAFAMENFRLTKIINQAGDHIDKIYDEANSLSPNSKHNPLPKLPH